MWGFVAMMMCLCFCGVGLWTKYLKRIGVMDRSENFFECITAKRWGIDMWLLLYIDRKSHMGSQSNGTIRFDLQRPERLWSLTFHKGAQLGHMLLLNVNRKPYTCIGSPVAPSHLTLSNPERSESRSLILQSHILLLSINRKPYIESPMAPSYLTSSDLERSKSPKFRKLISNKGAELGHYY